ncbi:MAG: GlsB/YeaQ/YmgE family stress response membrane protein [Sphingomicrobium sp.]
MFSIIGMIISGLIVGILARFFYPGAVGMSWLWTIGLGIAGSLLAGLITARGSLGGGFHRAGFIASIIGAMVLIFLGRTLGWG